MKKLSLIALTAIAVSLGASASVSEISVVPRPAHITVDSTDAVYRIPSVFTVSGSGSNGSQLAKTTARYLEMAGVEGAATRKGGDINVATDNSLGNEDYTLAVRPERIDITSASDCGLFYAVQTLAQMTRGESELPLCTIVDTPRHGYRGLMLDVVRCYIPPHEIKRFIDVASRLKINNLHLHLTDDNGWRLEIKKYPKLTEVGAWRVDRPELFPGRLNQRSANEPTPVGGFYTQTQMRDIVEYAAERHVNVIPEIEMPAHSAAAIASYPELACRSNNKFVGVFPGIGGKDASIIMCAGNDKVFEFYENVLDEVMDIFPSPMINLGGDEANKTLWDQCELCMKRIADLGLKNSEELQAYFMDRINHYVRSHGRTAMGWDEVTYGNPKEEMVILGWQGDGSVAVDDSRRSNRKFILTPAQTTYLIRYQGPQWFEPWTYFGNNTLADIHAYEPVKSDWTPQLEKNLIGVQGSLWSEFCSDATDMQYLVLPRLLAVADIAWRQKGSGDWQNFLDGVDRFETILDSLGMNHARSMWNIQHTLRPDSAGRVTVELRCERPDAQIRYSFADSTFNNTYTTPLTLDKPSLIYASTFKNGEKQGQTLTLPVNFNKATGQKVYSDNCRNGLTPVLTNGLNGSLRNSDFEWAGWWNAPASFTVDLGSTKTIDNVTLGTLINSDICVAGPKRVELSVSTDGIQFTPLALREFTPETYLAHPATRLDIDFTHLGNKKARYIKIEATNPGPIPDGMAREGTPTWLYFDEITVK